jgi:hypothetical protein
MEVAFLDPHGGDLNGFAILRGEAEQLDEIRRSDDFALILTRANLIVESLGVVAGITGDALAVQLERGQAQLDELT